MPQSDETTAIDLQPVFARAGATAAFHAIDLGTGREVAHHADDLAVASVFKLPVLIELCRSPSLAQKNTAIDAVIGQAARLAVDWLRSR